MHKGRGGGQDHNSNPRLTPPTPLSVHAVHVRITPLQVDSYMRRRALSESHIVYLWWQDSLVQTPPRAGDAAGPPQAWSLATLVFSKLKWTSAQRLRCSLKFIGQQKTRPPGTMKKAENNLLFMPHPDKSSKAVCFCWTLPANVSSQPTLYMTTNVSRGSGRYALDQPILSLK